MTPKERRHLLFNKGKPEIRNSKYEDMGWLWAANKLKGNEEDQEDFAERIRENLSEYERIYILEDKNPQFKEGIGPVGLVVANYNEWVLTPHVEWFPWATMRNQLRCSVAFFIKTRYSKDIGVCRVHVTEPEFFKRLSKYVPLFYTGKIPSGRMDGDDYLFYIRGKKDVIR